MKKSGIAGVLTLLFAVMSLGCGGPVRNAQQAPPAGTASVPDERANSPRTNVEELSLLINMPYEVDDELVWKEDNAHKKLVAVMHLARADAERAVSDSSAKQAPQSVTIPSESWFPAELIAQGEMSGDDVLNGTAYGADAFLMEPFVSGRLIRIQGTDYFILQLSAK
jgi:hypothetical protein